MSKRVRALDTIKNLSDWAVRNPIFDQHVNIFDDAFTLEKGLNPDYYCPHGDFEDKMCEILFSPHAQKDSKIEILTGNIGTGKTTFSTYMGQYKLAESYKKILNKKQVNVFYLHLNCYNRYSENCTIEDFEKSFSKEFVRIMVNKDKNSFSWKFDNTFKLFSDMAIKDGNPNKLTDVEFTNRKSKLSPSDIMEYLMRRDDIDLFFIVIDNMDEIPKSAQEKAFTFALQLSDYVEDSSKKVSILIPLRQYTDKAIDTERYHRKEMPHYSTKDIMIKKLEHVKDIFNESYPTITHQAEITIYREEYQNNRRVFVPAIGHRDIVIENISFLFETFIQKIPNDSPRSMLNFIKSISSGNLKLVTKNTYNFFHSCKLSLTEMVTYVHTPKTTINFKEIEKNMESELYGEPIIYDLLMAIHYPFYDVEASNIVNVYNLSNSKISNDFRNTLCLPRLLIYLYNTGDVKFSDLEDKMASVGYTTSYYNKSITKGLEYCLLDIQHGTLLEHLSAETNIKLSDAGIYMVENIMANHRYLSYVCEDTPMEEEYIIAINEKYKQESYRGNLQQINLAIEKFYQFIKKEENKEISEVKESFGIKQENFLKEFSICKHNRSIMLYEHIRETTKRVVDIDL